MKKKRRAKATMKRSCHVGSSRNEDYRIMFKLSSAFDIGKMVA